MWRSSNVHSPNAVSARWCLCGCGTERLRCSSWKVVPQPTLEEFAARAAIALELSLRYTDRVARARHRQRATAGAELQQLLLPPRIAGFGGPRSPRRCCRPTMSEEIGSIIPRPRGGLAGGRRRGGQGPRASAVSALTVAALRAARQAGGSLAEAGVLMDRAIVGFEDPGMFVTALLARWEYATRTLEWLTFGHPQPCRLAADASLEELHGPVVPPLGLLADQKLVPARAELHVGDRVVFYSDGVVERRCAGGRLGAAALHRRLRAAPGQSAALAADPRPAPRGRTARDPARRRRNGHGARGPRRSHARAVGRAARGAWNRPDRHAATVAEVETRAIAGLSAHCTIDAGAGGAPLGREPHKPLAPPLGTALALQQSARRIAWIGLGRRVLAGSLTPLPAQLPSLRDALREARAPGGRARPRGRRSSKHLTARAPERGGPPAQNLDRLADRPRRPTGPGYSPLSVSVSVRGPPWSRCSHR